MPSMSRGFNAENLSARARRSTGLSDWGAADFPERLRVLVDSINTQAQLHTAGIEAARSRLHSVLCGRLRLVEDRKRLPGIAAEKIDRPIFVIGLPRAGTTFLHNLLAQEPRNRSPMTWEILFPSPPPEAATYDRDPRIEEAKAALAAQGFRSEELQAIHPFDAGRPEECNFMWELSLRTVNFPAFWNIPDYARHLSSVDFRSVYREHRQFLQHLQYRFRRDRWVLKSPAHSLWLEELLEVYPDACLIVCHRDPAKVLPSLSSNLVALRKTFSDLVPEGEFGMLEAQAQSMRKLAQVRARAPSANQFIDAHYLDVQADPMAIVRRIYSQFEIPLGAAGENAMRAWLARDRSSHASAHKHRYEMKDYGLDFPTLDRVMGEYIRDSGVQLERRTSV